MHLKCNSQIMLCKRYRKVVIITIGMEQILLCLVYFCYSTLIYTVFIIIKLFRLLLAIFKVHNYTGTYFVNRANSVESGSHRSSRVITNPRRHTAHRSIIDIAVERPDDRLWCHPQPTPNPHYSGL